MPDSATCACSCSMPIAMASNSRRWATSQSLIPLFALPKSDGTASNRHIEGAVKGEDAVAHITPRLRALLDGH